MLIISFFLPMDFSTLVQKSMSSFINTLSIVSSKIFMAQSNIFFINFFTSDFSNASFTKNLIFWVANLLRISFLEQLKLLFYWLLLYLCFGNQYSTRILPPHLHFTQFEYSLQISRTRESNFLHPTSFWLRISKEKDNSPLFFSEKYPSFHSPKKRINNL